MFTADLQGKASQRHKVPAASPYCTSGRHAMSTVNSLLDVRLKEVFGMQACVATCAGGRSLLCLCEALRSVSSQAGEC